MAREIKRPRNAQGRVTQVALRRTWHASILPRLGAHTPFSESPAVSLVHRVEFRAGSCVVTAPADASEFSCGGWGGTCPQALSRSAGSNPTCSTRPRSPARRASLDSHEAHSIGRRRIVSTAVKSIGSRADDRQFGPPLTLGQTRSFDDPRAMSDLIRALALFSRRPPERAESGVFAGGRSGAAGRQPRVVGEGGLHFGAVSAFSSAIIACIHSLAIWNNC
jgi:hypothetical protein